MGILKEKKKSEYKVIPVMNDKVSIIQKRMIKIFEQKENKINPVLVTQNIIGSMLLINIKLLVETIEITFGVKNSLLNTENGLSIFLNSMIDMSVILGILILSLNGFRIAKLIKNKINKNKT